MPAASSNRSPAATAWYAQHGAAEDAIRHALAAEDFEAAADLLEFAVPGLRRSRQEVALLAWLGALPADLLRRRPVLSTAYAYALLASGRMDAVETRLQDAERWLASAADTPELPAAPPAGMVVANAAELRLLPGMLAVHRAAYALAMGDVAATVQHARRALDFIPAQDQLWHGAAAALLGLAAWTNGDLAAAERSYADSMAEIQRAGHISDALGCALALADIRLAQGRLHAAMRTYEGALQLTAAHGSPSLRGGADMHVGMCEIYCERNELDAATEQLRISQELGELAGLPQNPYRWRVALAHIRTAHGDLDGALALLHEAEHRYAGDFSPNVRPVAALKVRLWLRQGDLGAALAWARDQDLSATDDLSCLREFEHITLARMLLAGYQGGHDQHSLLMALELLARLRQAAEAGGRVRNAIEILLLQALAHQLQGDMPAALAALGRSLALAAPEGYVRLFVDEGLPLSQLLRQAAGRGVMPAYTGKLLAAFGVARAEERRQRTLPVAPAALPLVEPLSQRELDVLRLFDSELSGPEIARELVVALSTVRTHTKSIYSKLNVTSRRAAVKRAAELHLL